MAGTSTRQSTWQPAAWRLGGRRLAAAGCLLAYAAALLWLVPGPLRWFAALVAFDAAVMSLPWRVPRGGRSLPSLWLETAAYQVAPVGAVAVVLVGQPDVLTGPSTPVWYLAAAVVGAGLVRLSGMRLRLLASGELAFLAGPDRPGHAAALASSALVAAACEEVLFRGVALAAPGAAGLGLALVGALAFVARHHLPPAASARTSGRGLLTQFAAAGGLLALTVASGSVLPAVLAHLINNAPSAVLAVQRGRMQGPR